jgi:hypothetical protein
MDHDVDATRHISTTVRQIDHFQAAEGAQISVIQVVPGRSRREATSIFDCVVSAKTTAFQMANVAREIAWLPSTRLSLG